MLTVIYLMISLAPLAPLAMGSKTVSHALTGECSGDCRICGCSAESMATRTCCCSKKKQQHADVSEVEHDGPRDCCKKPPAEKKHVIAPCGIPCNGGKTVGLAGSTISESIPYYFTVPHLMPPQDTHHCELSHLLISLHIEPPDPPPKRT